MVAAVQLQTHHDEASLIALCNLHHSTESALLNTQNDIFLNMAKGSVTALTLLDLNLKPYWIKSIKHFSISFSHYAPVL